MTTCVVVAATAGLLIWVSILLLPWRPWSTRESLDAVVTASTSLADITVLIPARNEADVIETTLQSLQNQGTDLKIIVVDDQSTDGTAERVKSQNIADLTLIHGESTPKGWSGKLWALEQARTKATTELLLLLDADIALQPGTIAVLKQKLQTESLHLVSLMARLRMQSLAEKVLIPAFIYFFKLLYPFRLSNNGSRFVAAAAGGCILLRADSLDKLGGFAALKHALIDDCTLARRFRDQQFSTWLGLTHSAISLRVYDDLGEIWHMVTRTAFTQLRYSWLLLLLCVCLMLLAFVVPTVGVFVPGSPGSALAMLSLVIMCLTYLPVVRYYRLAPVWVVTLPLAGTLYLLMTIHSALRHQFGRGANWKGRTYE